MFPARRNYLRVRHGHDHHRVTSVELFFDLVFVFAVTQLSHGLLHNLSALGAVQIAVLLLAMWWTWVDMAWITNWLDPDKPAVRVLLFVLMLVGLVLSASIPRAFEDRAVAFAAAYIVMQSLRNMFVLWALARHDESNFYNFVRIGLWHLADAPFWLIGALAEGPYRLVLWGIAVALETAAPAAGFRIPGLGRSTTADWVVEGGHLAERCGLFVIIALGESILITGANFAELSWTAQAVAAFVAGFAGSVAMWAIYFNIGAERSSEHIARSSDPGRLARSGYTYLHILIVAGIIVVAVGDELVLHRPAGPVEPATALVVIGGPALYLAGNTLFKRLSAPNLPFSHLVGLGLLALTALVTQAVTPLALSAMTTVILLIVAFWEWRSLGRRKTQDKT
jgi:low temperature requirement protein LtrA